MNIHECGRCEGCGHVTGGYHWEIPWTRWAPTAAHPNNAGGVLRAHGCPDCGGTGALLEMETIALPVGLASRRGLRSRNSYADHVQLVLQVQGLARSN
jgi:DnaJ-class molecular chaperone